MMGHRTMARHRASWWAANIAVAALTFGTGVAVGATDGCCDAGATAVEGKQVYFNQPGAKPSVRPRRFEGADWRHASSTPDRWYNARSNLREVRWSSWGGPVAIGEGTLDITVEGSAKSAVPSSSFCSSSSSVPSWLEPKVTTL